MHISLRLCIWRTTVRIFLSPSWSWSPQDTSTQYIHPWFSERLPILSMHSAPPFTRNTNESWRDESWREMVIYLKYPNRPSIYIEYQGQKFPGSGTWKFCPRTLPPSPDQCIQLPPYTRPFLSYLSLMRQREQSLAHLGKSFVYIVFDVVETSWVPQAVVCSMLSSINIRPQRLDPRMWNRTTYASISETESANVSYFRSEPWFKFLWA